MRSAGRGRKRTTEQGRVSLPASPREGSGTSSSTARPNRHTGTTERLAATRRLSLRLRAPMKSGGGKGTSDLPICPRVTKP